MSQPLELEYGNEARIYTYDRPNGHKSLNIQGISKEIRGSYTVSLDSFCTKHQTVILAQGNDWEIVAELRPRQFTQKELLEMRELAKLKK